MRTKLEVSGVGRCSGGRGEAKVAIIAKLATYGLAIGGRGGAKIAMIAKVATNGLTIGGWGGAKIATDGLRVGGRGP